jgi:hypothetical protein
MAITKQKIHQIQQRKGNRRAAYSAAMSQVEEKEKKASGIPKGSHQAPM